MRTIDKQGEPACLARLRREAKRIENETNELPKGKDWDPGDCADSIRESLHTEQGGLCAYCMGRITKRGYRSELHPLGGMKIEHWLDRSKHPRRMYDWDNLLGLDRVLADFLLSRRLSPTMCGRRCWQRAWTRRDPGHREEHRARA